MEPLIEELIQKRDELQKKAQTIVDDYWHYFRQENENIIKQINAQSTQIKTAILAPTIDSPKGTEKIYITWKLYRHNPLRRYNKRIGERAHKAATPPTVKQLTKRCVGWETKRVLRTESSLATIREHLNAIHDCIKILRRADKLAQKHSTIIKEVIYESE